MKPSKAEVIAMSEEDLEKALREALRMNKKRLRNMIVDEQIRRANSKKAWDEEVKNNR